MSEENNPAEEQYALSAHSLVKQYANAASPALNKLSLQISKGTFFGLLGPNGAGKTTALSIFSGLFPQDSGRLKILGQEFGRRSKEIKKIFGLVPQEIALYDNLTAQEHLVFLGKLYGLRGKKLRQRVEDCLEVSGLTALATRLVGSYSGGMKRRLNIVAGLIHQPQILFLDEPTVGVDAQSRHLIHEQLRQANQAGTTILYTSHSLDEAEKLCDQIGIIDHGQIIEQGQPKKLIAESGLANLEELFLQLTGRQLRDA